MRQLFRTILILANVMLGTIAGAQTNPTKIGTDPTVEVITDYQGKILESDKLDAPYSGDSLTAIEPAFTYQVSPLNWSSDFNMKPIPPAAMQIQTGYEASSIGYFRGGLAYPVTPDLNLYLRNKFFAHSSVNIYVNHQSFWGKTPIYKDSPQTANPIPSEILGNNSKTRAGIALQHFWEKTAIDARMEYRHSYVLYHGQDTLLLKQNATPTTDYISRIEDDKYIRENLSQAFHNIKTSVNFYSITGKRSKNSFNIGGIYDYIRETAHVNSNRPVAQHVLGLDLQFNRKLLTGHAFDIRLNTRYNSNYGDNKWDNLVANFVPAYQYNSARTSFVAGVNVEGVHSNNKLGVHIYPQVNFSYSIFETYITPYLSAGGGTKLNNYAKITGENPYVLPGLNVANTRHALDLNAGIKGSINTYLSYQVNVGYTMIDSLYFYTNSIKHVLDDHIVQYGVLRSNFDVRYDNISRLSLEVGINTKIGNFEAIVQGGYFQYSMSNEEKPWHRPNIEAGCNLRYTLLKSLILNVNGTYRGEAPVLLNSKYHVLSTVTPAYIDLGAMVEYRLTERASVYIQGTNLLNDNYQQYYLYYNPGLTVGAGFSVAF